MTRPVAVVSFGYLHGPTPAADVTVDVRDFLFDPHPDPRMRNLTGLDPAVARHVMGGAGAPELAGRVADVVAALAGATGQLRAGADPGRPVSVAVGCAGGRHRSVAAAEFLARTLTGDGLAVTVAHRDVARPVVGSAVAVG